MGVQFKMTHRCKVYPAMRQWDCDDCRRDQCHECHESVDIYWKVFCDACVREDHRLLMIARGPSQEL
jgi:hypothetical protein